MSKRILVVEDRDDLRTILVAILKRFCGYETIEAANGAEAIEKAEFEKPDLILWISISLIFPVLMQPRL